MFWDVTSCRLVFRMSLLSPSVAFPPTERVLRAQCIEGGWLGCPQIRSWPFGEQQILLQIKLFSVLLPVAVQLFKLNHAGSEKHNNGNNNNNFLNFFQNFQYSNTNKITNADFNPQFRRLWTTHGCVLLDTTQQRCECFICYFAKVETKVAQIPGAWSPGWLNFVRWRLIFSA